MIEIWAFKLHHSKLWKPRQHFSNKYNTCTVVTSPVCIGSKKYGTAQLSYIWTRHYVLLTNIIMLFIPMTYSLKTIVSCQFDMLSCSLVIICSSVYFHFVRSETIISCQKTITQYVLSTRYYMLFIFIMSCQKPFICIVTLICYLVNSLFIYVIHFNYVLSENHYVLLVRSSNIYLKSD